MGKGGEGEREGKKTDEREGREGPVKCVKPRARKVASSPLRKGFKIPIDSRSCRHHKMRQIR